MISKYLVHCKKYFTYHFTSIPRRLIRTQKRPAPNVSGFIAQLVRASPQNRGVTSSNPVEVLTFSGFPTQLLKLAFITYLISKSAVHFMKYFKSPIAYGAVWQTL